MWDPTLDELHKVDGKKTRREFLDMAMAGHLRNAGELLRARCGPFLERELEAVIEHLWLTSAGNRRLVTKCLMASQNEGSVDGDAKPSRPDPQSLDAMYRDLQRRMGKDAAGDEG